MNCCYCHGQRIQNLKISEILWKIKEIPQLCQVCASLFQPISLGPSCLRCQKKQTKAGKVCQDCCEWQKRFPTYDFFHRAFFVYDTAFQNWLYQYKFMGDIRLSGTFAEQWKKLRQDHPKAIFCPIPLSNERLTERGFNQVSEMLEAAAVDYRLLLDRKHHATPQAKKTRKERLESIQPFILAVEPSLIKGQTIFLIDDVYTTGQTLFHAASCLLPHQPGEIYTYSLAR